jgi:four helix bundle protein
MRLDELEVYQVAMDVGERVWAVVEAWTWFAKDTVGKQWVRAADSMAANLSEGYGRFFYKENKQFTYYARGSLFETTTWLEKAHNRSLIADSEYTSLRKDLESLAVRLNNYIRSIGRSPKAVHEEHAEYGEAPTGDIELPQPMMRTK